MPTARPAGRQLRTLDAGAEDPTAPPEWSEFIRDSMPDARLVVFSPAAHLANIERPKAVTRAVPDHLQAVVREGA